MDNPDDPIVLTFSTVGQGAKVWHLRQSKLAEYREAFPGIDVLAEARRALLWCNDNPTKRKTAKGMPAFLSRWLAKAQDHGPQNGRPSAGPVKPKLATEAELREKVLRLRRQAAEDEKDAYHPPEVGYSKLFG